MGIPIVQASALALFMESFIYGIFCSLFLLMIIAMRPEISKRKQWSSHMQRIIFYTAFLMLAVSTAHLVIDIVRAFQGFPVDDQLPTSYLSRVNDGLFYAKISLWLLQTCITDGIQIWRCWVIYKHAWIPTLPLLVGALVYIAGTTMIVYNYTISDFQATVFDGRQRNWMIVHLVATLYVNTLATACLVWRLIKRSTRSARALGKGPIPFSALIVDTAAIYSATYLVAFVLFLLRSNAFYPVMDATIPIAGVCFTLLIVRIRLFAMLSIKSWSTVPPAITWADPGPLPQSTWTRQNGTGLTSPSDIFGQMRHHHGFESDTPSTPSIESQDRVPQIHVDISQISGLDMEDGRIPNYFIKEIQTPPERPATRPRSDILPPAPAILLPESTLPASAPRQPSVRMNPEVRTIQRLSDARPPRTPSLQTSRTAPIRTTPGPPAM